MKKITYIVLIIYFLTGCSSIKENRNQVFYYKKNSQKFTLVNNAIILESYINQKKNDFLFDTGYNSTLMIWKKPEDNFVNNETSKDWRTLKDARGEKINYIKQSVNLSNDIIEFQNISTLFIERPQQECYNTFQYDILGFKFINNNDYSAVLKLDFDNEKIELADDIKKVDKDDFVEVKGKVNWNKIELYLTIQGKEDKFLFDTGNSGSIILKNNIYKKLEVRNELIYEGATIASASGYHYSKSFFAEDISLDFMSKKYKTRLSSVEGIDNNVGMDFIKNFNWIIDTKERKIYAKPIQNFNLLSEYKDLPPYKTLVQNGKLIIIVKQSGDNRFNINDTIESVNDKKITPDNLCEMQKLLNETEDWSTLEIEVEK